MSDGTQGPQNFPPITNEDLLKLEVPPQLIPFVVSTAQRAEQSSTGEPQLTSAEAENLVEILDRVVSSNSVNAGMKNRCFKILRKVSPAHGILPKSYYLPDVTLSDTIPYASGGFADIWKGQRDGRQVGIKAFRTQAAGNLDKIKRRFYREIIGWKYVVHPNVVPFSGISETLFSFCIINPWLSNGNILEFTRKNKRVNRLKLLAQAASGLEYLHSLGIVHSDVNPGNILISEDGAARLGDFGITGVITDPTVVEPGSTTTSKPGVVRYMAPELLNPSQFNLLNSNPTKESDVYSLAVTAYEVLTGILPYGTARDGIIIFHVVTGDRPPRPENVRWLRDQTWNMIIKCWSEQRHHRWDIRSVCNQLSASSIQEVAEDEQREVQTKEPILNGVEDPSPPPPPRRNGTKDRPSIFVEEPGLLDPTNHPNQPKDRSQPAKRGGSVRPRTAPRPKTQGSIPKKRFTFPTPGGRDPEGTEKPYQSPVQRSRKSAFIGTRRFQAVVNVLRMIFRLRKPPRTDRRPSK